MVAVGLFLAVVLWLGWDGGPVGEHLTTWLDGGLGLAAYALPLALCGVGGLMLVRSALVDVRPFRTGLVVGAVGLAIALGKDHGGAVGSRSAGARQRRRRDGSLIVGVTLLLAGALLVSGASAGALLRRSGHAVRRAGSAARRSLERPVPQRPPPAAAAAPVVTHVHRGRRRRLPGRRRPGGSRAAAVAPPGATTTRRRTAALRFATEPAGEYRLPDRSLLRTSPPAAKDASAASARTGDVLVQTLAHFGIDAVLVGQIAGPRVVRYELQLAPGTKVSKVAALKDDLSYALATTEIRILAPIPGKQAVGVEVPNLAPASSRSATSSTTCRRRPARSRSGSGRTSPATRSGPTSPACRTC